MRYTVDISGQSLDVEWGLGDNGYTCKCTAESSHLSPETVTTLLVNWLYPRYKLKSVIQQQKIHINLNSNIYVCGMIYIFEAKFNIWTQILPFGFKTGNLQFIQLCQIYWYFSVSYTIIYKHNYLRRLLNLSLYTSKITNVLISKLSEKLNSILAETRNASIYTV